MYAFSKITLALLGTVLAFTSAQGNGTLEGQNGFGQTTYQLDPFASSDILKGKVEFNQLLPKEKPRVCHLTVPNLKRENILKYKAGVRPFRQSGPCIQAERWKDKLIIHDYGHGGSGISLSWGSAYESLKILKKRLNKGFDPKKKEIAIIGSGVIGLSTAHLLADKGWDVKVYASQFPPHTTSDIAPGLWNKVLVGGDQTPFQVKRLNRIVKTSLKSFQALADGANPEFKGVSYLDIYSFKEISPEKLSSGVFLNHAPCTCLFNMKIKKEGMYLRSLIIDTSLYIPDLYKKAKAKGVQFYRMTFKNQEDLNRLPQRIIVNCTGFGAKALFNDPELVPIAGQLIELKPQAGLNYMLAGPSTGGMIDNYLIPLHDKLILGGSYQMGEKSDRVDFPLCQIILRQASQFYSR
jgi:glycine/D-amino acid oxidase-like deaminating enzyme